MTFTASESAIEHPAPGDATVRRIETLDLVRGVALLGILLMNAVAFALPEPAYSNLAVDVDETVLDSVIGAIGRVFVDQKMMAIFSLLFGAGIALFADAASRKGRRPLLLSVWRNLLLFAIGIAHTMLWDGDVLTVYAVCAPFVLLFRKLPASALAVLGATFASGGAVWAMVADIDGGDLGDAWTLGAADEMTDLAEAVLLTDVFGRALGLMLIGVALFKWGILQGELSDRSYARIATIGGAVGVALSMAGWLVHVDGDWMGSDVGFGYGLSTLGTVPLAVCYVAVVVRLAQRGSVPFAERLQAVGRMALTNYLTQSVIGVLLIDGVFVDLPWTRTGVLAAVVAVWALQLLWSPWWLGRFRFGPVEWLWRSATYRSWQALSVR